MSANPFRLNLEQQKTRAKELCRAVRAGEPAAMARIGACRPKIGRSTDQIGFRLSDAQMVIARELGLLSWPRLKTHITAMERARTAIGDQRSAPDGDVKTLHLRCGSDIAGTLTEAGFSGDFHEYSNPYCQGPVTGDPDQAGQIEARAHFLTQAYGGALGFSFSQCADKLRLQEAALGNAAERYERVVLWFEHDSYDQLVLIRCLAHFATGMPGILELVSANGFPGSARFIGLGQLPPEALRLLWSSRTSVSAKQLALGHRAWQALKSPDPAMLAAMARTRLAPLPDLAPALRRHLRELPSVRNGLGLTEELILEMLAEGNRTIGQMFHDLMSEREPLPWLGDVMFLHIVETLRRGTEQVFEISPETAAEPWPRRALSITETGRKVLRGATDWLALTPPDRWVGGIRIRPTAPAWRWDDDKAEAVLR